MPVMNGFHLIDAQRRAPWSTVLLFPHAEFTSAARNAVELNPSFDWIYGAHFNPCLSDARKSEYERELREFGYTRVQLREIGWPEERHG